MDGGNQAYRQYETVTKRNRVALPLLGTAGLAVAVALAVTGILARGRDATALARETDAAAISPVAVIAPGTHIVPPKLVLPGDVEAWYSAPIYGQVSGYVTAWYKDIGASVKQGDLLATINVPELDAKVEQAKADLAKSQAEQELAQITAHRWQALWHTDAVSRQESDVAVDKLKETQAATQSQQGQLDQLLALQKFERLVAPFDGVVTARRTDVGALIQSDSVSSQPEMFEVSDIHMMRVYVRVPQSDAAQIHVGMRAELHLPGRPDKVFPAVVKTTSGAINLDSRTLLVELWAANPDHELAPGTYADVSFQLSPPADAVQIPSSALIFQDRGLQVATVDRTSHAHLRNVTIGRDMGSDVIVAAGITAADRVIDSPPDSLNDGDLVQVVGDQGVFPGLERDYDHHPGGSTQMQVSEARK
jgi:RND family efflux transporter MFP subunit